MTRPCSELDLLLMVYADGEATTEERREVESHIAACPACRQRLTDWQEESRDTSTLIAGFPTGVPTAGKRRAPAGPKAGTGSEAGPTGARPDEHTRRPPGRAPTRPMTRPGGRPASVAALGLVLSLLAFLMIPMMVARQQIRLPVRSAPGSLVAAQPTTYSVPAQNAAVAQRPAHPQPTVRALPAAFSAAAPATPAAETAAAIAADSPAITGRIAFVRGGDIWLHSKRGDTQITHVGTVTAPRWSPSGRWLLYETTGGTTGALWIIKPGSGEAATPLPEPAESGLARWSPTRDEIAVAPGDGSLWLVQAGSDAARPLLASGGMISNLAWSPNGSAVALERRGIAGTAQSIWLVTRGGSISEVSTGGTTSSSSAIASPSPAQVPVLGDWSPSGTSFTFWLSPSITQRASTPAPLALWSQQHGVRTVLPNVLMYRDFLTWAPDGHAAAVVASVLTPDHKEQLGQVTVVPTAPGAPPHTLTDPGRADGDAAWSPDGGLIAYAGSAVPAHSDGAVARRRIWVETPEGTERHPMSPGDQDSFPQWSKDGKEIVYVHQTVDGAQLWVVARDGSNPHPVIRGLVGIAQLPSQQFGASGLVSYRGVFAWSDAAGSGD